MKEKIFNIGDQIFIEVEVKHSDIAAFNEIQVHPVYSTFALGRDAEWACRQFVLQLKEAQEEGIGTFLNITHHAPAMLGEHVKITATLSSIINNNIECTFEAFVKQRLIASGSQGQKILKKEKIKQLFEKIKR